MKIKKTDHGFEFVEFDDANGEQCSLQQSSATMGGPAGTDFIWLGIDEPFLRMHLCRDHVMQLIPLLQRWVVTGSFSLD